MKKMKWEKWKTYTMSYMLGAEGTQGRLNPKLR